MIFIFFGAIALLLAGIALILYWWTFVLCVIGVLLFIMLIIRTVKAING